VGYGDSEKIEQAFAQVQEYITAQFHDGCARFVDPSAD
jgi:hypothetical protein